MTLWRELGGGRRGEKPAFLENGFQGGEEHVGRGCQGVGRGRAATSSSPCAAAAGLCLRRSGRRRLGSPVARADPRAAGGLGAVVAGGAGVGGEARVLSRGWPAGLGGARLPRACAWRWNALPARAVGLVAAAAAPRGAGGRGSRAPGERPGRRAMCHGGDGGAGGRGEPVVWRRRGLGVEGRDCAAAPFGGLGPRLRGDVGRR